jgi:glycosyltransferase involved in cell wall biosynthesis
MDPEISVIVPVYQEADSLPVLWDELDAALAALRRPAEIIFVDDGSTDGSTGVIQALAARDHRVRVLRFAANAGLSAAFYAGMHAARGGIVVTLDSDLQNDPADIGALLAALAHADAAVGWRQRRHDPWLKRVSSRIANAIRNWISGDRVHDSACSLRAMRAECISAIPPYRGMHRFVPTLCRAAGYRVVEVPVHHRARRFGRSHFGVRNRALTAFVDLLAVTWMMRRRLRYDVVDDGAVR